MEVVMMNVVDPSLSSDTAPASSAVLQHHLGGIVAEHAGDQTDEGVEQTDVDHDPEVHDREHEQGRRRRHGLDRVHDHVPRPKPAPANRPKIVGTTIRATMGSVGAS
jgi:hypothetical protein